MKKILVIGGTRLMGKHLVRELLNRGFDVTIATRGLAYDDFGNRVRRICIDRTIEKSLIEGLSHEWFDVVFDQLACCSNDVRMLLDHLHCGKYVMVSSTAVYDLHDDMCEEDFDPQVYPLVWCDRGRVSYGEAKRQAECALFQCYSDVLSVAVRFPFVIGADDYTERLFFYVDYQVHQKSMYVDNDDRQLAFVRSDEAGQFLSSFAQNDFYGPVNGAAVGTMSIRDVFSYVERRSGLFPVLSEVGDVAPYNGVPQCSVNTDKAREIGFDFSFLKPWVYTLIDGYLVRAMWRPLC